MKKSNVNRQHLEEEAYRFNFFKAVHLLEKFNGGGPPGRGLSPDQDPVRFSVQPGFVFPASDIQNIKSNGNGSAPRMTVNFMGLIGPQGVLPDWYNTHAQTCNYHKDYCFTDFLDLFHHRLISLFYLAWKKYRLAENFQAQGTDPISGILANLAGVSEREKAADPQFSKYAHKRLIYFCGLVGRTVPTVAAIEKVVAHAVGAPARVEQFVERLIPIHEQDRTCLGRRNSTLKHDALCGGSIRDSGSFFRVHIGPLTWERYLAFAPKSENIEMIRQLIAYLAGIEYEFEIRLLLPGDQIPALSLGSNLGTNLESGAQPARLGRTATLRRPHRPSKKDITVSVAGSAQLAKTHEQKGGYGNF